MLTLSSKVSTKSVGKWDQAVDPMQASEGCIHTPYNDLLQMLTSSHSKQLHVQGLHCFRVFAVIRWDMSKKSIQYAPQFALSCVQNCVVVCMIVTSHGTCSCVSMGQAVLGNYRWLAEWMLLLDGEVRENFMHFSPERMLCTFRQTDWTSGEKPVFFAGRHAGLA